jgi:putative oxidoreductase
VVPTFANVQITSLVSVGGLIELIGGILFTIGLFTRPVAFILSDFTAVAVAYFMAHANKSFFPVLNGGELAALYGFAFPIFRVFRRRSVEPGRDPSEQGWLMRQTNAARTC